MSDTPRTDEAAKLYEGDYYLDGCVTANFARELERELNEERRKMAVTSSYLEHEAAKSNRLREENAKLREWKDAVINECAINFVEPTTPYDTLVAIQKFNRDVAIDPNVSEDAAKLRDTYKADRDRWRSIAEELGSLLKAIRYGWAPQYDYEGADRFADDTDEALSRLEAAKKGGSQ